MENGDVAQLGERRLCKPQVAGSSPVISIRNRLGRLVPGTLLFDNFILSQALMVSIFPGHHRRQASKKALQVD
jgi:hypothetical protein